MCDEGHLAAMGPGRIDRRRFGMLGAGVGLGAGMGASLAGCATMGSGGLTESNVSFSAPGGTMDAFFVHPAQPAPAVILWPDIAGLRDAKKLMARRLAGEGYAVIVLNPYYRSVSGQQFADFDEWREQGGMAKVAPWREKNTAGAVMETARAVIAWLDRQEAVDTTRGIGTQGYCMGGPYTIWTAAAVPARVKAAASFHGGGLVGEGEMAPINMLDDLAEDAQVLIAIARNDDADDPDAKTRLRTAADAAGLAAGIEVYAGDHGWTVPDSPVYDEAAAERAYANLLELYRAAL